MKNLFKVGGKFFSSKEYAKEHRNMLEGYTPVIDEKTGKYPKHIWKYEVKRGPDHWKGEAL